MTEASVFEAIRAPRGKAKQDGRLQHANIATTFGIGPPAGMSGTRRDGTLSAPLLNF